MRTLGWINRNLGAIIGAAMLAASCVANPVKTAMTAAPEDRPETVAYALAHSYAIVEARALSIVRQPETPREVKQVLIALHESASPAAERLERAAETYKKLRESVEGDGSASEKLAGALAALNAAINDFAPKGDALAREIGGGS